MPNESVCHVCHGFRPVYIYFAVDIYSYFAVDIYSYFVAASTYGHITSSTPRQEATDA